MPTLPSVAGVATVGLLAAAMTSRPALAAANPTTAAPRHKGSDRQIAYTRWGRDSFRRGRFNHTRTNPDLVIAGRPDVVSYRDPFGSGTPRAYDRGRWFSPWVHEAFGLTELIASYNAKTPVGTFIEIAVRGRTPAGRVSSWTSLGRWASHDRGFHRMSLGEQSDDLSRVSVDTLVASSRAGFEAWQLRVTLMRRAGSARTPSVRMVGAVVSRLPSQEPRTSKPRRKVGRDLDVPAFSQQIHVGEYPQWNGGGEAWCSPTSTAMLLAYWSRGPTRRQYAWVDDSYPQPWVDHAARATYAWGYEGSGVWPFNTAYAGMFGLHAFVTRLRSLRQAELFIRAGIPLVASISFEAGELDGAPIASTAGHLLVIRGFTSGGKVVVNDPAAPSAATVRRVYRRGQFERAWVGSTGGVVYVIHPPNAPLPASSPTRAW